MEKAIESLQNGGVILYPSDTLWGIGCDATREDAVQRIAKLKSRTQQKSFIILVDSFQMLEQYIPDFHPICYDLVDISESPLTIIYPGAKKLAPSVLAADGSVGIRLTKDPLCCKLIRSIRKPLLSTSANISGCSHPTSFSEIGKEILSNVDEIVEDRLNEKLDTPSQVIKIDLDGSVKVIRH